MFFISIFEKSVQCHVILNELFFNLQQKVVAIPQSKSQKNGGDGLGETPSFVRNVMGSSAGAGSGEFHVYRHLRRKEYARQKQLQQQSVKVRSRDW